MSNECRLRIDPVLVNKFHRLPGGINEVGVKIIRDLGLKYFYDKSSQNLEIIGTHPEILTIAIETLRFWVEDDDFPTTGVTCQVGYPNKCMVIWRYHGDYAKKLDHLFPEEISKLKQVPTVNVKAVPSKRNPEYVEVYCHFSFYDKVKDEAIRLSYELSRISQNDFFAPYSDLMKAKLFARSKADDPSVLYALKEYPDRNRIRVWIFGREQMDVIRAKREWMQHVGNDASDTEITETVIKDGGVSSARFYGHPSASTIRESITPLQKVTQNSPKLKKTLQTSMNLSVSKHKRHKLSTSHSNNSNRKELIKIPTFDNRNFPRPSNFVYPVDRLTVPEPLEDSVQSHTYSNPFNLNELNDIKEEPDKGSSENPVRGYSGWEDGTGTKNPSGLNSRKQPPNRIYVHHQVKEHPGTDKHVTKRALRQVVHPETNLIPGERYRLKPSERVLTSVNDPKSVSALKRNKHLRAGVKKQLQPKVMAFTRQKPVLQAKQPPQNIRYHINVNGLDIYMYKHSLVKLTDMDTIVNVVNSDIRPGGALAANLFDMAGPQVTDEIKVHLSIHGPLHVAENMVSSAGRLPVLGIVHVAGPIWENYRNISEEECARDLHKAIYSALKTAEKHKYRKVGMPVICAEPFFGVPKDLVAEVYVKALVDYSMGMGPLYPVLEIHLVDTDAEMLSYIKDAYEKWNTDYNMMEMTNHFKSELPDQQELSERTQSAVTLKELPSHRSENMVTFTEQSYTAEGNQQWSFDVLKKLIVHVYTGSIVRMKDVEAIACGVNHNLKGSLAKQVSHVGGTPYDVALKRARGNRELIEGDVLVTEAGNLATDLVLHSIVSQPIYKINEKNLVRLDRIYSQVLQAANKLCLESLAMPLIGTGRLREKFEVEQCSLQLIDNIIELCLSQGKSLKIKELHLVNVNTVMTQSLTQALRTRAHTKLRVERDPQPLSRQDVLSLTDPLMTTQEVQRTIMPAGVGAAPVEDIAEEFKLLADMHRQDKNRNITYKSNKEMNKPIMNTDNTDRTTTVDKKDIATNKIDDTKTDKDTKVEVNERMDVKSPGIRNSENSPKMAKRNNSVYLSRHILKEHERMMTTDAVVDTVSGESMDQLQQKTNSGNPPSAKTNSIQERNGSSELMKHEKTENLNKKEPQTRDSNTELHAKPTTSRKRRLPPISGLVSQRSRAESYRSMYIRRKKIAAEMIKDHKVFIRRSQSENNLQTIKNVNGEHQRKKGLLGKIRGKPISGGDDDEQNDHDKKEREKFQKESENFFTRTTRDRYRIHKSDFRNDAPKTSRSVLGNTADKTTEESHQLRRGLDTERMGMGKRFRKQHVKERVMWDKEREDMYMKEMDLFALASEQAHQAHSVENKDEVVGDNYNVDETEKLDKFQDKNKGIEHCVSKAGSAESIDVTNNQAEHENLNYYNSGKADIINANAIETDISFKTANGRVSSGRLERKASAREEKTINRTLPVEMSEIPNTSQIETGDREPELKQVEHIDNVLTEIQSNSTSIPMKKPIKLIISTEPITNGNETRALNSNTTRDNHRNNKDDPETASNDDRSMSSGNLKVNSLESQSERGGLKDNLSRSSAKAGTSPTNPSDAKQTITPRAEDVTIRDKLTVEIDVLDRESTKLTKEKEKIKRFWEVVGGKEVEDEAELYGDGFQIDNDKVLMTRVTKERKMSAKSKGSKQGNVTNVTSQKVGKYNVTVEVV